MSLSNENRPLHLLSLDGGGVRGLSSILILKHLMGNISKKRGRIVQPWEEFDMIGGTSTGGLIAVMLGRLRMTLEECEDAYLRLSEEIFNPKRSVFSPLRGKDFLQANGKFDHKVLEEEIKRIIVKRPKFASEGESTLLQDPDPHCKVFVCAVRTGNTGLGILRSYDTTEPHLLFDECKIWEACRATTAAVTFFDPIKIGKYGQWFADGGVLYNNPVELVHREASTIWPDRMDNATLISIGTGSAPRGAFRGNLKDIVHSMVEIATETEKTNTDFFWAHQAMLKQNRLFRFNVLQGLAEVGLQEWKEKEKIANTTQAYLEKPDDTRPRVNLCVEQICKSGSQSVGPSRVDKRHREHRRINTNGESPSGVEGRASHPNDSEKMAMYTEEGNKWLCSTERTHENLKRAQGNFERLRLLNNERRKDPKIFLAAYRGLVAVHLEMTHLRGTEYRAHMELAEDYCQKAYQVALEVGASRLGALASVLYDRACLKEREASMAQHRSKGSTASTRLAWSKAFDEFNRVANDLGRIENVAVELVDLRVRALYGAGRTASKLLVGQSLQGISSIPEDMAIENQALNGKGVIETSLRPDPQTFYKEALAVVERFRQEVDLSELDPVTVQSLTRVEDKVRTLIKDQPS